MTNRSSWPLIVFVLLALAWWFSNDTETKNDKNIDENVAEEQLAEPPPEVAARTAPPARQAKNQPALAAPTLSPSSTPSAQGPRASVVLREAAPTKSGRRPLPPGAVPYRKEGRLLVAFGDILLGEPKSANTPASGIAQAPTIQLWNSTEIPYFINPKLGFQDRVMRVIEYFNANTPIRFVPFNNQPDAIVFEPADEHCRSYLGRIGGHQPLYLSTGCHEPEISHEIMHALGFIHEQSRPDRDRFVKIHWERIQEDKVDQFELMPDDLALTTRGRPFDYRSVMLYEPSSFPRSPGEITLESLSGTPLEPVQTGLSTEDLERLFQTYGPKSR